MEINEECNHFRDRFQTLILATADRGGVPEASYAPYVQDSLGNLYVCVSELGKHTANLRDTHRASVLLLEDEMQADELFARKRLTYQCQVTLVERDHDEWSSILDQFADRFGEIIAVLREPKDFHLFRIAPEHGTYIRGFAETPSHNKC